MEEELTQTSYRNVDDSNKEKNFRVSNLRDLIDHTVIFDEATGHRFHIELVEEETSHSKQGGVIREYESMEASVNEMLRVALKAPTPDESIEVILEYLGKYLGGERTYIFEQNASGRDDNTYEWVAPGVEPQKENLQDLPPEVCARWYEKFCENKHIIIRNLEDIRYRDPIQYDVLKMQDIHSLVVVPLYDDGKVIAFYGIDNPAQKLSFEFTSNMLQIMGHFLVSSLKRRNLVRELQLMSYSDPLTHLGNRYALDEYLEGVDHSKSIGVVYCDISGLKRVNDEQGHMAGDELIRKAGKCLEMIFQKKELFRIGGDEFLALCQNTDEESFERCVDLLREQAGENDVTIAIGSVWKENADENIDHLITEAEQWMYSDKEAYYRKTGMLRRVN